LVSTWETQAPTEVSGVRFLVSELLLEAVLISVYASVGACIPVSTLSISAHFYLQLLFTIGNQIIHNNTVNLVTDAFLRASTKLRKLAIQHADTAAPAQLRKLDQHIALLITFAEGSRYKLKFVGITLSAGTVRAVLVTAATLIVALWSVARGLGLSATMETFCPGWH
jgi:hypothetical protein